MLTDPNKKISIIAYYFSKFDKDAIHMLGYDTFSEAFENVSLKFGKVNSYMKLRRDEFDALTGNTRKGWHKRSPAPGVMLMHNELKNYSFEELTDIVKDLIDDTTDPFKDTEQVSGQIEILKEFTEDEVEQILNRNDASAGLIKKTGCYSTRIFDNNIQKSLKALYRYKCQICGATATVMYGVDVSEAHHIEYFSKTANNNPNNIIILCPDHHRIVHKANAFFNFTLHQFEYNNARVDPLMLNLHI